MKKNQILLISKKNVAFLVIFYLFNVLRNSGKTAENLRENGLIECFYIELPLAASTAPISTDRFCFKHFSFISLFQLYKQLRIMKECSNEIIDIFKEKGLSE